MRAMRTRSRRFVCCGLDDTLGLRNCIQRLPARLCDETEPRVLCLHQLAFEVDGRLQLFRPGARRNIVRLRQYFEALSSLLRER